MAKERELKTRAYIAPDILLRLLINKKDRKLSEEVLLNGKVQIVTSIYGIYEALACIDNAEELDLDMLLEILKNCAFTSPEIEEDLKPLYRMTPERKEHLREVALGKESKREA